MIPKFALKKYDYKPLFVFQGLPYSDTKTDGSQGKIEGHLEPPVLN